ncbi:MAG: ParB N-terminal domain-containing protein [Syntrophorhabdaceae bacterium]|nr:ParB N-terminal domain-containing protein [Syntrophorhabdaceae bacterium]
MRRAKHARALRLDKNFTPVSVDEGDEFYPNGIFAFNITKMLEYIHNHRNQFIPTPAAVKDFACESPSIRDVDSADISRPVILAEIAPGRYNLIDGHHRMEKARRAGLEHIMAYRVHMEQHLQFLTTHKAYSAYVEYWNSKLKEGLA